MVITLREKVILTVAFVATLLAWVHGDSHGASRIQAKWDKETSERRKAVITAQASTLETEHRQADRAAKVDQHAQDQLQALASDRDRAVRSLGSLRDELARVRADALSETATRARLAAEASAAADSLGECSERYTAVAAEHDRLAIQVGGLLALTPEP